MSSTPGVPGATQRTVLQQVVCVGPFWCVWAEGQSVLSLSRPLLGSFACIPQTFKKDTALSSPQVFIVQICRRWGSQSPGHPSNVQLQCLDSHRLTGYTLVTTTPIGEAVGTRRCRAPGWEALGAMEEVARRIAVVQQHG